MSASPEFGRGREGPNDILQQFQGFLQTDGYSAYEDFDRRPGITLLHCMAHARRKFHEALHNDPDRAEHALALFQQLYGIERRIKESGLQGTGKHYQDFNGLAGGIRYYFHSLLISS